MALSKVQLEQENQNNFPDNNQQLITPQLLRQFNTDMIDSLVDENTYNADSASWNAQIAYLDPSGSIIALNALEVFTASAELRLNALEQTSQSLNQFTASQYVSNSYFATTGSNTFTGNQTIAKEYHINTNGIYWNDSTVGYNNLEIINSAYGNVDISAINGRVRIINSPLLLTGSALTSSNDISTSANIYASNLVDLISSSAQISGLGFETTTSFNAYTASQNFLNTTFATTASVNSLSSSVGLLQTFSGSEYKADSSSFNTRINSIQTINTASFATTGSNTFIGNQIINGFISASLSSSFKQIVLPTQGIGVGGLIFGNAETFLDNTSGANAGLRIWNSGLSTGFLQFGASSTPIRIGTDGGDFIISGSTNITGSLTVSGNISSSGNIYAANLTGSGAIPAGTVSSSQQIIDLGFATTASVNSLSSSIFQTDITQSNNIASNSSSIGLLQTEVNNLTSQTSSYAISSSVKGVTDGLQNQINTLATTSSVNDLSGAVYILSQSVDSRLDSLETAGYVTSAITASSLVTASVSQSTITFTKGDGSTFNIVVADISGSTFDTSSLVTTASFNAYTQSTNDFTASISTSVGLLQTFSGSQYKGDSASFDSRINAAGGQPQVQDEGSILGNATSFNFIGAGVTTALSAGTASVTIPGGGGSIDTGSFATTGSNTFTGNQTIEGSIVSNPTTGLTELFSQAFVSGAVQYNITASNAISQSNLIFGGNPGNFVLTGSVVISGSNNILFNPAKTVSGPNAFNIGYVNGNNNIFGTIPTLHTQSLFNPTISNNIGTSILALNFITSSLGVPTITNNISNGTININHQSGSISYTNNIGNGAFASTANITNLPFLTTINGNANLGNGATLNHISSSVTYQANIGGGVTVNNNVSTSLSATTNGLSVISNTFGGSGNVIYTSGSAVSTRRVVNQNIFGGNTNVISASAFNSENQNLIGTVIWGTGLTVSATHPASSVNAGGGAFFGKFNDTNNLYNDSGKILFAVGTGTSTTTRKTALSVDSSSVVNISGSLTITGSTINIDGSGNVTASTFLATSNGSTAFIYNQQSTGSVSGIWNTNYGKDGLQVYQYQGQPYAFNVLLTANQLTAYTGSEFQWGLQTNGTLALPGGGSTYFAMSSGSTITGSGAGANKVGLDYLETAMILDVKADTAFNRKVYVDKGMYISQSVGGSQKPALIVNGTNANNNRAIIATGSVLITGSLSVSDTASFDSGVVLNNNSDLYVYGHKQFNIGVFYSTITQSGSAGVSQSMQFDTTDISQGVSVVNGSQFTLANAGVYNIQFSAQILADTGADDVWIWLKKNGTNIPDTAGRVTLANNDELMAAWNYVVSVNANDYIEIVWQNSSGDAVLLYNAPTGNIPAVTSVIATVTQVR